ncbi:hypothetical protein PX699_18440 [Sphingobium sp. H39-3-25]|uniref:hypothetical protein n=1 Tax=Sphingobium arseniciresistens TaxID=3030834 RepID=UPI0023B88859|nr:hypothetical protein [Sphingobium arseniciresistens]|tara:strand:- start:25296 stop:25709 length:414 start_codon:yes stop_codon:yes gene_type:complete
MPTGKATIIDHSGLIATSPPSPVSFIASKFPTVKNDMTVYFERSSDPTVAKLVRPATAGDQLAALAEPSLGLTPKAKGLMAATAERLSATLAHLAGQDISEAAEFEQPIAEMTIIATRLEAEGTRVGVAIARIAIAE